MGAPLGPDPDCAWATAGTARVSARIVDDKGALVMMRHSFCAKRSESTAARIERDGATKVPTKLGAREGENQSPDGLVGAAPRRETARIRREGIRLHVPLQVSL